MTTPTEVLEHELDRRQRRLGSLQTELGRATTAAAETRSEIARCESECRFLQGAIVKLAD